jgi:hypothetical protein
VIGRNGHEFPIILKTTLKHGRMINFIRIEIFW